MEHFSFGVYGKETKKKEATRRKKWSQTQNTSQEGKEATFSCAVFGCGWYDYVDHGYILVFLA